MPGRSLGSRWHGSRASATSLGSLPTEVTSPNRLFTSAAVTAVTACHRWPGVLLGEVETNASLPLMDLSIMLSRGGGPAHTALAGPSPQAAWCDLIVWRGLCVCIYAAANRGSQEEGGGRPAGCIQKPWEPGAGRSHGQAGVTLTRSPWKWEVIWSLSDEEFISYKILIHYSWVETESGINPCRLKLWAQMPADGRWTVARKKKSIRINYGAAGLMGGGLWHALSLSPHPLIPPITCKFPLTQTDPEVLKLDADRTHARGLPPASSSSACKNQSFQVSDHFILCCACDRASWVA